MKIFDSFDTKLDEKELLDAIKDTNEKYGEGHAILTKKHRVFLLGPLFLLILTIGAFALLVWFSYSQYYHTHPLIFWLVGSGQFAVTLVWIIHSYTTIFATIKKHKGKAFFSSISEKSLKDGRFESYLRHSFISLILQAVLMILDVVLAILLKVDNISGWLIVLWGVALNIGFIAAIWRAIEKIIDFEMYFNIFTPEQFTFYRQKGILKTESVSIATSSIKMIKEKKGWWGSLWGYGYLSIHPEGGANDAPPVKIAYVAQPKVLIKKLNDFIDMSKRMMSDPVLKL